MFMLRRTHRRQLFELQRAADDCRRELAQARDLVIRRHIEIALLQQARAKADSDCAYWKTRAEKFLDQTALRFGTINEPTMAASEPPVESRHDTVFRALGVSEINHKDPVAGAASAALSVTGVNADDAMAAVIDVLADASR